MICVSVLYAQAPGKRFDHDYYAGKHMPMVQERLQPLGLIRYEIDRGIGGAAPGSSPPFACIGRLYFNTLTEFQQSFARHGDELRNDVPNYTDIQPEIQISQNQ